MTLTISQIQIELDTTKTQNKSLELDTTKRPNSESQLQKANMYECNYIIVYIIIYTIMIVYSFFLNHCFLQCIFDSSCENVIITEPLGRRPSKVTFHIVVSWTVNLTYKTRHTFLMSSKVTFHIVV